MFAAHELRILRFVQCNFSISQNITTVFLCGKSEFSSIELDSQAQPHGAVIRTKLAAFNPGVGYVTGKIACHKEVVYAPADVLLPGLGLVGPPGIGVLFVPVHVTEGIDPAKLHKTVQKGALNRKEASVQHVLLGTRKIDFPVGYVEIAADHHGLFLAQILGIGKEGLEKAHLVVEALEKALMLAVFVQDFGSAIGKVAVDEMELLVFQMKDASFALPFFVRKLMADAYGINLAEDCHTRIALLHSA